jgi:hypothetical protein
MADCGFPLPCESTISSATADALKITNTDGSDGGAAIAAIATGDRATALKAQSNNGPGIATRSLNDGSGITANSETGDGVAGLSVSGIGVSARSDSGIGVRARSSSNYAVFATSGQASVFEPPKDAVFAVFGDSSTGHGVVGSSTSSIGVMGRSDTDDGVVGRSTLSTGVVGNGFTGVMGNGNVGVMGNINSLRLGAGVVGNAGGTNSRGIVGNAGGFLSLAGLFTGSVMITGSLTKGGGGFKIDHPLDSSKKYLNHSFVESPEMKNLYDGIAILDNKGETSVELPEYFESLNRDFCYQLTSIGTSAPNLYIAEEVSHNRFKIAGGKPGMRVSWQITGIRHDPWAEANPLIVEEEKPENQQGYYLHPELYDQPEERGVEWAVNPELMRQMKEEQQNQTSTEN